MRLIFAFLFVMLTIACAAQDCQGYYFMKENSTVEMTSYDRKGKKNGVVTYNVESVDHTAAGYSARVSSTVTDDKGKNPISTEGVFQCDGGSYKVDMKMSMAPGAMEGYKNMEIHSSSGYVVYPASFTTGSTLPDASFEMKINNDGHPFAESTYSISDRKIEDKETITTAAGSWECYIISGSTQMKTVLAGTNFGIPMRFTTKEWFAPGFGVVKSETYNKGKLMGYSQITSLSGN